MIRGLTLAEHTHILNDLKLSDEVQSACLAEFRYELFLNGYQEELF